MATLKDVCPYQRHGNRRGAATSVNFNDRYMKQLYANFQQGLSQIKPLLLHALMALMLALVSSTAWGQTTETFNSNGTFTVPLGVTEITVEAWGAGGGGGKATGNPAAGGGGAGGSYAKKVISVTPGQS